MFFSVFLLSFSTWAAAIPKGKRVCGLNSWRKDPARVLFFWKRNVPESQLWFGAVFFAGSFTSSPAYQEDSDLPLHGSLSSRTCSAPADSHLSPGMPLTVLPVVRKFSSNNFWSNLFMLQNISGLPFVTPPSLSASQHFLWVLGRDIALITLVRNQGLLKLPLSSVFIGEHANV